MAEATTPTTAWTRLAAPDRHATKGPVAPPLFPFAAYRPASTIHGHAAAWVATSTI
jgi:hypothetical protein